MKHVLAIGDVTDTPPAAPTRAPSAGSAKVLVKADTQAGAVRQAAGPAVWIRQGDGSWVVRWRGNDTWWDLSARYLQAGKRWRELFDYQSDAFHARVPEPIAIYTTALVTMPPEAVKRAQLLGEILSGGPSPGPAGPGPGAGPLGPPSSSTPSAPSGASSEPVVIPASPETNESSSGGGHLAWWILGALGLAGATTIGVVAYRAHRANAERT